MRECPGRLVQGHGFGIGTAGAGTVAGADALIGGFGLDILPTPFGALLLSFSGQSRTPGEQVEIPESCHHDKYSV